MPETLGLGGGPELRRKPSLLRWLFISFLHVLCLALNLNALIVLWSCARRVFAALLAVQLVTTAVSVWASSLELRGCWRGVQAISAPFALVALGLLQLVDVWLAWRDFMSARNWLQELAAPPPTPAGATTPQGVAGGMSAHPLQWLCHRWPSSPAMSTTTTASAAVAAQRCPRFQCKGVDGVCEGAAFAGLTILAMLATQWHVSGVERQAALVACAAIALPSAALSAMEVDRGSSAAVAAYLDASSCRDAVFHFLLRMFEIAARLWVLGTLTATLASTQAPFALWPGVLVLDYVITASLLAANGGCSFLCCFVALPFVVSDLAAFVDVPTWGVIARTLSKRLWRLRLLELCLAFASGLWAFGGLASWPRDLGRLAENPQCWMLLVGFVCAIVHQVLLLLMRRRAADAACAGGLHQAATRGDADALERMLRRATHGGVARIDRFGHEGLTALHLASRAGSESAVKVLLRARAGVAATARGTGETPVMLAAAAGHDHVLRRLLNEGGVRTLATRSRTDDGDTALHLAQRAGHSACVHTLLRARADLNLRNDRGYTAADLAAACSEWPPDDFTQHALAGSDAVAASGNIAAGATSSIDDPEAAAAQQANFHDLRATPDLDQDGEIGCLSVPLHQAPDSALDVLLEEARRNAMPASLTSGLFVTGSSTLSGGSRVRNSGRLSQTATATQPLLEAQALAPRPTHLASWLAMSAPGALRRIVLRPSAAAVGEGPCGGNLGCDQAQRPRALRPIGIENFRIVRLLGEGNFGVVYEVRDLREPGVDRRCALKILHKKQYRVQSMLERARSERHVLKAAHHPLIVRLLCAFRTPAQELVLVMEYCPHGNLHDLVVRSGSPGLPETSVRRILADVLLALQYLHEVLDVVFRDLKPENIVFDAAMRAKLTDFGLVKCKAQRGKGATSFVGSTYYVAPEVAPSGEPYGKDVDLYALGLVAFVCLTGGRTVDHDSGSCDARVPPETREELSDWLACQPQSSDSPSAAAVDLIDTLTSPIPAARGTARSVRRHRFFAEGADPSLATEDDWVAWLPEAPPDTPTNRGVPSCNDSQASSWSWQPRGAEDLGEES